MTRARRSVVTAISGAVVGLLLGACGFPEDRAARPLGTDWTEPRTSDTSVPSVASERVVVWFVHGERLVARSRRIAAPADAEGVVDAVAAGISAAEAALGLRSAIPGAAMVAAASSSGGFVTVRLDPGFLDVPATDQVLALGQLVMSLTGLPGIGRVRFEVAGVAVAVPLPKGGSTSDSVSRDDFQSLTDS